MGFTVFDVQILRVDSKQDRTCGIPTEYMVYVMHVKHDKREWIMEKRYSDFERFEKDLRTRFWYMGIPKLPPKQFFFSRTEAFLDNRKKELQTFIQKVLGTSCWSQSDKTWEFLTDEKSIIGVPDTSYNPEDDQVSTTSSFQNQYMNNSNNNNNQNKKRY